MTESGKKIGLALSGGGYRASTFHLGTLKKLHELGVLDKVDVMSTISGGSITGAAWCLHDGDYNSFHEMMINNVKTKSVIKQVLTSMEFFRTVLFVLVFIGGAIVLSFTQYSWLVFPMLGVFFILFFKYQFKIFPVSKPIEKAYDKFFYSGKTLNDLKAKPLLAIGSSNLHSGRPFTFSRNKMSDSSYSFRADGKPPVQFMHENFPVARAVMASSCVPFAFTPVRIDKQFYKNPDDYNVIKPVLVDGGVYDNQGIQKLTQPKSSYECDIIITSDAGGNFMADKKYPNVLALLMRTVDLFMYRIKATQMVQNIYRNADGAAKPIAYFSLGWRVNGLVTGFVNNLCDGKVLPEVVAAHGLDAAWIAEPKKYKDEIAKHLQENLGLGRVGDLNDDEWKIARGTGTNLTCLSNEQVEYLIRQAENLTEVQVKLYCPMLVKKTGLVLNLNTP